MPAEIALDFQVGERVLRRAPKTGTMEWESPSGTNPQRGRMVSQTLNRADDSVLIR